MKRSMSVAARPRSARLALSPRGQTVPTRAGSLRVLGYAGLPCRALASGCLRLGRRRPAAVTAPRQSNAIIPLWDSDFERCSLIARSDVDRSSVLFGDLLHDGEPEAGSALLAGGYERLKEPALDLARNTPPGVRDRDEQIRSRKAGPESEPTTAVGHRLHRVSRKIVDRARNSPLVEPRHQLRVDQELELYRAPVDLVAQLLTDVVEELVQVDLAHEDIPLAARKLQHLPLHGAEHVELLQDLRRVLLALLSIVHPGEQLNVAADDGHRCLEVVDDLRQKPSDRGEPLAPLTRGARMKETHRRRYVRSNQGQERDILVRERPTPALGEHAQRSQRSPITLERQRRDGFDGKRKAPLHALAPICALARGRDP